MTGHATQPIPVAVLPETGMVYRQMDDGAWYPLDVNTPTGAVALHECDAAALVRYAPAATTGTDPARRDLTVHDVLATLREWLDATPANSQYGDALRDVIALAAPASGPDYAIIETSRGDGIEYPVAERNTNGPAGWRVGDELVPDSAVTHVEPVTVIRRDPAVDLSWPVDGPDPINALRDLPGSHPHIDIVTARLHALLPPALEAGCPECGSDDDCDDYDWATRARLEAAVLAVFEEYGYREGGSLARLAVIAIEELDSAVAPDVPWRAVHDLSVVAADGEQMAQAFDEPTALLIANAVNAYRTTGVPRPRARTETSDGHFRAPSEE